jgi:hypothetical protein
MQEPVGIARRRLERVAEGVPEVEQRPLALLGLVAGDDPGLHLDRAAHRALAEAGVAGGERGAVDLEPVEERRVAQKPVLHDLAVARAEIAGRQRSQHVDVGEHQRGLVEGADEVLAVPRVDAGLAADGTVDLRQKRRRHLHEAHAAPQYRGREAGEVADHPAAQGDDDVAPLDLRVEQPFDRGHEPTPALRPLARRQRMGLGRDAGGVEARDKGAEMRLGDARLGQDGDAGPRQERRDLRARACQKPRADADVVGARAELNPYRVGHRPPVRARRAASRAPRSPWPPSPRWNRRPAPPHEARPARRTERAPRKAP